MLSDSTGQMTIDEKITNLFFAHEAFDETLHFFAVGNKPVDYIKLRNPGQSPTHVLTSRWHFR